MLASAIQIKPKTPLLTDEAAVATLAKECHMQVLSLALLAGASPDNIELTNENWYYLLSPIVDRLRQLNTLIDQGITVGEVHLYPTA